MPSNSISTNKLSANGKNALSSPKIDSVSANGSEAVAQIEYSVHGTTTKDTLTLRKEDARSITVEEDAG